MKNCQWNHEAKEGQDGDILGGDDIRATVRADRTAAKLQGRSALRAIHPQHS